MKDLQLIDGEVTIVGGAIQAHDSVQRHRVDLLRFNKGDNVFFPTLGVGIMSYLNDNETLPGVGGALRSECNRDGITPPRKVDVVGQTITLYD
ncbi:hypothetical protein ACAW74_25665 [Fibrella sp. WM1]|uniref:hypothetical protein n=1 Tax=Fibrella musci TaxID=3242485 RepID=UPI0035220D0C